MQCTPPVVRVYCVLFYPTRRCACSLLIGWIRRGIIKNRVSSAVSFSIEFHSMAALYTSTFLPSIQKGYRLLYPRREALIRPLFPHRSPRGAVYDPRCSRWWPSFTGLPLKGRGVSPSFHLEGVGGAMKEGRCSLLRYQSNT